MNTSGSAAAWVYCRHLFGTATQRPSRSGWGLRSLILAVVLLLTLGIGEMAWALRRGNRGPEVTALQVGLRNAGFFQGQATGYYGSKTEAAVRNFQRAYGLPVDGVAGPNTLSMLYATNRPPLLVVPGTPYQFISYPYSPCTPCTYPANTPGSGGVLVQPTYWVNPNGNYWTYPNTNYVVTPMMVNPGTTGVLQRPIVDPNSYYYYRR
ncbi:peptidoglycan-binding protein [Trichothermofontia sichuanensis B231]|uniref:peptidoglycan-binding domain-containing protein n=1 Tax=Trichothermofontia sichuanensis TaxID=3045816 RepID=UPI0022485851|nr:peptidoglycan-binding domain-containing protein [Trichothermofontia sichuanensis]UZQ52995.1 peptidoglycan-binding protein [Trichothermofontia sichuanensis B231]